MAEERRKVAVLGGGVGAMVAAFALTADPKWREKLDLTVYQMGWRLGGKGASGRRASAGQRIEEHGLHVWSGFYDNAIHQMKACLNELNVSGVDGVYPSFEDAFIPHNNIALGEKALPDWTLIPIRPPFDDEATPGDGGEFLSPWDYLLILSRSVRDLIEGLAGGKVGETPAPAALPGKGSQSAAHELHDLVRSLPDAPSLHGPDAHASLTDTSRRAHAEIKAAYSEAVGGASPLSADMQLAYEALDLGGAVMRGMVADGVYRHGFDRIDAYEISHWLTRHGAKPTTVDGALVRAVYDYAFGFSHGICDHNHRAIGAGTFVKGSIRLFFTYKGAIFFKMRAGMGDTIFTPYYKALKRRGVKFEFFHKVSDLKLDPSGRHIDRIEIDRQATPRGEYDPLVRVGDIDCWPAEPDYDQLEEGDTLKDRKIDLESSWTDWAPVEHRTLRRGVEFDDVVLGISLGALPLIAGDLIAADPAWRRMVDKVETAATQAMQLWLKPTVSELGWPDGDTILTAYADEMNTWADMSHLKASEAWPENADPGSIAYFCGPLPDPERIPPFSDTGFPARARAEVRERSRKWLESNGPRLWPKAFSVKGGFDDSLLVVADTAKDADPWEGQYFRANYEPSERYVLSVPGSTTARLRADRSGFDNLWLAGDWTYTGINAGCVEAAAMSGLRAAAGLMGVTPEIVGEEADPIPGGVDDIINADVPKAPVLRSIRSQNASWPWSSVYGMAQTTGATVVLPFARQTVEGMLPKGLVLAEQDLTPTDMHPVILLFARQRDVRPNLAPVGMNYSEFICAVPWVKHADPGLSDLPPMITPTKLYLDSLPPILLGIYGYGFPKERASMQVDMDTYIIREAQGDAEIISASFHRTGPKVRAWQLANFDAIRPAYEMAMVTRNRLGQWQYSVYDFSLGQAELEPLEMEVRIASDALSLPQGVTQAPSLDQSPFGAFFLTADATINNPLQSFELRRILREMNR
ncbi:NAD(P)-binding protein [Rhodobacterales bacterium HKCCSP123]|nr:NAD(P)-binding protein [Rhodobacterales bacterium HKCCSP123]